MDYLTREKAVEQILKEGLPEFFIEVINGKLEYPIDMYFTCSPLYFLNSVEQNAYQLGDVIPLWASFSGDINYAFDIKEKDFILFYLDDGKIECRYSWEQLIRVVIKTTMETEYETFPEDLNADLKIIKIFSSLKIVNIKEIIRQIKEVW